MAYVHVCNHKDLMLCVMLPNFNHSLKPALTLSTTLNDHSQDGASNKELSCRIILFHSHSPSLSPFLTDRNTHTHTPPQTHTHTTQHHTHGNSYTKTDRQTRTHTLFVLRQMNLFQAGVVVLYVSLARIIRKVSVLGLDHIALSFSLLL